MERKRAIVIGAGFGGLAMGIRLQSLGFDTTIVEKLDGPGGRAYVRKVDGFTFDMGPTVITVPHFIEELFALERDAANLAAPDFPPETLVPEARVTSGISSGPATSKYVTLTPILPFYRIYFDDGTFFDYDGDPERTREQIRALAPEDLEGYERFHAAAEAIFKRGFLELGYTYFGDIGTMLRVVPDLVRLDAVRPLFSFVKRYFRNPKMQQVFSFEPLLIGGNPLQVPAIYAMIHFVEKTWGIHFARGGTGALVQGLVRKFEDLGGVMRYNSEVRRIIVTDEHGREPRGLRARRIARGVELADGTRLEADLVVSNGDYATTYLRLIDRKHRRINNDLRVRLARQSMSLIVIYFGFRADPCDAQLRHHNIILGPRYEGLLEDIFNRKTLADDFSQYLHIPTLTDPSLAPPGHHAAYTLVPVPHNGSGLNWSQLAEPFVDKVLRFLDERGYLPGLMDRLVHKSYITPDYFEGTLNSWLGNGFGVEPLLIQSAYFRPHNRSEDIERLYLVGASVQPGGGTPSVMMSAKMTARVIAKDYGIPDSIVRRVPESLQMV
ncbi:phytoene desaturase family protein [Roseiflexus sp.]|uniref:phytoene desaturase family protein n=1 Tax=Roseiflexus sp. TaxID=2562120 RepID=UPI0021DD8268|nr:phytoene desaturase family protein [Roseiflexus sp.]GIW02641.1 MAG: phytoene dehydrogenase [Roseiflexus sp.]